MTDTKTALDRAIDVSRRVYESNEKALGLIEGAASGALDASKVAGAIPNLALLNGLLLQQAALDVAIVNAQAQVTQAASLGEIALTLTALVEKVSNLATDIEIISGQNPGGYRWNPQVSVEIANAGDLR